MRNLLKIVLMAGIVFYAVSIWADTANTANTTPALNQTTVVVADRSATALQLALQSAFSEVMMKMSGNPNEMNVQIIQNAAKNVTNWVESYSYTQSSNGLLLQVVFDQDGLQKLLNKASQKVAQTTQTTQASQLNAPSTVMVAVSGIHSLADYVQVMRALRDKSDVMHVSVKDMQSDHVLLKVKVIGNSAEFQKVLASDGNFKAAAISGKAKLLQYYWMGNQA